MCRVKSVAGLVGAELGAIGDVVPPDIKLSQLPPLAGKKVAQAYHQGKREGYVGAEGSLERYRNAAST
jgi:hypothetical protein